MSLRRDRRDEILTAAARLFAASGFHGVSIDDLGAELGFSGPAIYRYFPSKESILGDMLVDISQRLLEGAGLQLRVAAGEGLPITQQDVRIEGNAVEARIYAEDGHRGFLPASGTVLAYDIPPGVRVDSGITRGSIVGTSYDPLLAKVIATGSDREAALDALDAALAETVVLGVAHNVGCSARSSVTSTCATAR